VIKKPRSLITELKCKTPASSPKWWGKLPADELETLTDAVQAWRRNTTEDGKRLRQFFPSRLSLYRYLRGEHEKVPCCPPALSVGATAFMRFLEHLERQDAK